MTATKARPKPTAPARRRRPLVVFVVTIAAVAVAAGVWLAVASSRQPGEPAVSVLHQDTRMGAVDLVVGDLDLMRGYYTDAVGLTVISEAEDRVELGSDGEVLLTLTRQPDLTYAQPTTAGLFHSAILYPDAATLAGVLQNMAAVAPATYSGSADHRVSLAFYFGDPEGNGLELYTDRPAEEWEWNDGRVTMGSEALDVNQFIADNIAGEAAGTATMGHVHLRVGELDAAEDFYVDVLGFAITSESTGALFMSAGGYHHHLAANVWSSAGAPERAPALGLGSFDVLLADGAELEAVSARLADAGLSAVQIEGGIAVDDPWGNTVRLVVGA